MALAAHSPTDRVEQLIILTEKLTEIILTEIGLLKERRPSELKPLEAEKTKLSKIYAREMALINQDRSLIADAKQELKLALKKATALFRDTLGEYTTMLSGARQVTEDMVHSIATEVAKKRKPVVAYGADSTLKTGGSDRPTSLTFNQVV